MKIEGITVHDEAVCVPPCPFHAPSEHPLKAARIHLRADKDFLVERICEHGVGHDDPDSVAYLNAHGAYYGVHGCDGCCTGIAKANVHLRHCYQGEYAKSCKYGEPDCPMNPSSSIAKATSEEAAKTDSEHTTNIADTTFEDELNQILDHVRYDEDRVLKAGEKTWAEQITAAHRRDIVRWMEYMLQCDRDNKAAGHKWSSGDWRKFVEAEIEGLKSEPPEGGRE